METVRYDAEIRHDGRVHTFTVENLTLPVCKSCGAKVFTDDADQQINLGLRQHLGLMTPEQIRGAIDRIGESQTAIASSLGIAKETLSRWINEVQIQNKSMDTLLRIYFAFPCVRKILLNRTYIMNLGLSDIATSSTRARVKPVSDEG